ncbi:hypothetical protein D3C80_1597710 [compost metagenome]
MQSLSSDAAQGAVATINLPPLLQRRRDVVAIDLAATSVAEGRAHAMAISVVNKRLQRQVPRSQRPVAVGHGIGPQPLLDRLEKVRVDDGRVPPRHGELAVDYFADVNAVLQQMEQSPAAVGDATRAVSLAADPHPGQPALGL